MATGRQQLGGAGTQTAALGFGGIISTTTQTATESWNGSAWTTVGSLNTARRGLAGSGTQTLALAFGGYPSTNVTEEWTGEVATAGSKTLTTS